MGQLTRDEIVAQGLALAACDDLSGSEPDTELKAWLRRQAAGWPWPMLHRFASGISLPAGTASFDFGAGSTITDRVQRVLDPAYIYDTPKNTRRMLRVMNLVGNGAEDDETLQLSSETGTPSMMKVYPFTFTTSATAGKWTIYPLPVPDRAYLLKLPYLLMPADPGASDYPWYPSDRTMIQLVLAIGLKHRKEYDAYQMAMSELDAMVARDRMDYGQSAGVNQSTGLDTRVFSSGRGAAPWPAKRML